MSNISFCIPSKNNLRYLKAAIYYLRKHCVNPHHEILIWIDKDDDGTSAYLHELNDSNLRYWVNDKDTPLGIGNAYDFLVSQASNDLVMMYHADMIAAPGMDVEMLKHHTNGTVVSATRIEPPLHPGELCKITEDFGLWPEKSVADGFREDLFVRRTEELKTLHADKITNGVFAPWLIHKYEYNRVGGHDPLLNSLAEDNDIFNRMLLMGISFCQPWTAYVYHLTCRGGQFEHATVTEQLNTRSGDWNLLSYQKTREFIRKWGYPPMSGPYKEPIVWPSKRIHADITGWQHNQAMYNLLQFLEPYFVSLTIDNKELETLYIEQEQQHTKYLLEHRFVRQDNVSITITFDVSKLENHHLHEVFMRLPLVVAQAEEPGTYEVDIFTITVTENEL